MWFLFSSIIVFKTAIINNIYTYIYFSLLYCWMLCTQVLQQIDRLAEVEGFLLSAIVMSCLKQFAGYRFVV